MIAFSIRYNIPKEKFIGERRETVDAKNAKSAINKLKKRLAKSFNKFLPKSKQTKTVRINVISCDVIGYY